jgi:hypothetical protein
MRIKFAYQASILGEEPPGLFTKQECAALRLARLSANTPLITPLTQVDELNKLFDEKSLVKLNIVCSLVSMIQRYLAIAKPKIDEQAMCFLETNNIEIQGLRSKYLERLNCQDS